MLLIFDEVQCGMGATGRNWCCEHFDVMPDLMSFGKKAQVCGVMAGPRLDEVKDNVFRLPSRINSTWGGNFTDMVRSTHFLKIIEEENLVENAGFVGEHFLSRLHELQEEIPIVSAVRGRGLFLAFDLPDPATRDQLWKGFFDGGVLTLKSGEKAIRFRPSLDITREVVDEAIELMRAADDKVARAFDSQFPRRTGEIATLRNMHNVLKNLGLADENLGAFSGEWHGGGEVHEKISPVDGKSLGKFRTASAEDYEKVVRRAQEAFLKWRATPGPVRGETVRQLGNALREQKDNLGRSFRSKPGKIIAEGKGEVQEMIDICDFAVGQSRMLYGLTIQSERARHRLMEQWHPLGLVGVISAFNFPVAVWSWNAALAAVCGDATIWKPSEKTPLTAIAVTKIAERVCREYWRGSRRSFHSLIGDRKQVGETLVRRSAYPACFRDRLGRAWESKLPKPFTAGSVGASWNWAVTTR